MKYKCSLLIMLLILFSFSFLFYDIPVGYCDGQWFGYTDVAGARISNNYVSLNRHLVGYPCPIDGKITKFRTNLAIASGNVRMIVCRFVDGYVYHYIGTSQWVTAENGLKEYTLDTPIEVEIEDQIGLVRTDANCRDIDLRSGKKILYTATSPTVVCNNYAMGTSLDGYAVCVQAYVEEFVADSPPFYSDVDTDGVTQVGQECSFSAYWEDDFELDTCYFSTNNTGIWVNHTISVSGNASWANKTIQLNFTVGIKVEYLWYCSDNASQWNNTSTYYLITTAIYITFRFNNGGQFRCNNVTLTNGTSIAYAYNVSIELVAVPINSSFIFQNFNWVINLSLTNPYNYFTSENKTVWCNFDSSIDYESWTFGLFAFVVIIFISVILVTTKVYKSKKEG